VGESWRWKSRTNPAIPRPEELFQLLDEPYPLFEGTTQACTIER
jgi:hypothetical protein